MRFGSLSLPAVVLATTALFALAAPAFAQVVVVDNGPFGAFNARDLTTFAEADDFTLSAPATFNAIRFWATDFGDPALFDGFSGTLSWFVHANAVDRPAPLVLASGTVSSGITLTDVGTAASGSHIFQLDFSVPNTTLFPGTYWLRLKENAPAAPGDSSTVFWVERNGQSGNPRRADDDEVNPTTWTRGLGNVDLAYQLRFSAAPTATVPEPGTLALLLAGSIATGTGAALRRRRA